MRQTVGDGYHGPRMKVRGPAGGGGSKTWGGWTWTLGGFTAMVSVLTDLGRWTLTCRGGLSSSGWVTDLVWMRHSPGEGDIDTLN